jgi:hypothetical protein
LKASVLSACTIIEQNQIKTISKTKLLAFSKLVGAIEKKIMLRKMDFWLPLRVHCAGKSNKLSNSNSIIEG